MSITFLMNYKSLIPSPSLIPLLISLSLFLISFLHLLFLSILLLSEKKTLPSAGLLIVLMLEYVLVS